VKTGCQVIRVVFMAALAVVSAQMAWKVLPWNN
jgi:hypothetical protein